MGGPRGTGCLLCKRRNIKCDAKRPACLNCHDVGIACPGYVRQPRHLQTSNGIVKTSRIAVRSKVEEVVSSSDETAPSPPLFALDTHLGFDASIPPVPVGSRFSPEHLKLMFNKYLCKHPVYDKLTEAVSKPLGAVMFVSALYNLIGDYHAMRDEPVSNLAIAVKMEAVRLLSASLTKSEGTTALEIMLSIITVGGGVMNYSNGDWTEYDQHLQACDLLVREHWEVIQTTPFGVSVPMMLSFQSFRKTTADNSADTNQTIIKSLPPTDSPLLSAEDAIAAQRNSELACYCPFGFNTLSYSSDCKPATLDILWHIHEVVKVAHMETPTSQHRAVKRELIRIHVNWLRELPSAGAYDSPYYNDFTYECCRLTALLQMSMLEDPCVMDTKPLVTQLKENLKKTELGNYWGNMIGVLWWVLTIALPLSHNTSDWKFFHIQCSRIIEQFSWPPAILYKAAVGSVREYFRFREACRRGKE